MRGSYFQHGVMVPTKGSPVIVDLGANIGLFSLSCLRHNPRAVVLAVEPAPSTFGVLERNLSAHPRARCAQLAVRDRSGHARLHIYDGATGESSCNARERAMQRVRLRAALGDEAPPSLSNGSDETVTTQWCSAVSLSQLLQRAGLTHRIDLLKVDCEGDECLILNGLQQQHWRLLRQVVLEVHDIHARLQRVVGLLRRHGFRVVTVQQQSSTVRGYHMEVPCSLRLWYVFATRSKAKHARRSPRTLSGPRGVTEV